MFAECVTTRLSVDADGGFLMRKAVVTTARALFAVGATGMLGMAMLAAPTAARASQGGCSNTNPCSLAFMAQPAGTTVGTQISSSFNSPGAGPVTVKVVDQTGATVTNSKAAITIAITSTANPGSGTLSGTKTVSAVGGVASFSDLSINNPGLGYTLTATSRGMSAATSASFDIWGSLQQCSSPPCSASASTSTPKKAASWTVSTSSARQVLAAGLGGVSYDCAGSYHPLLDPFSFDVLDSSSGVPQRDAQYTVVLRIEKSTVQSSSHPGASTWQICYASPTTFASQPNTAGPDVTIGGVIFHTGLLTDCGNTPTPPCVQSRTKDNAGDVLVTFLASGDPIGKG